MGNGNMSRLLRVIRKINIKITLDTIAYPTRMALSSEDWIYLSCQGCGRTEAPTEMVEKQNDAVTLYSKLIVSEIIEHIHTISLWNYTEMSTYEKLKHMSTQTYM
jgi:hypothetical protein